MLPGNLCVGRGSSATPSPLVKLTRAVPTAQEPIQPANVAWELRTYQLRLGYRTVPTFLRLFEEGLRDKLAVDDSGASSLVSLLYSDCGSLNVVRELWRHDSLSRAQDSRLASRKAAGWRGAIDEIAELAISFDTQFLRPLKHSPWQ